MLTHASANINVSYDMLHELTHAKKLTEIQALVTFTHISHFKHHLRVVIYNKGM